MLLEQTDTSPMPLWVQKAITRAEDRQGTQFVTGAALVECGCNEGVPRELYPFLRGEIP